MTIFERSLVFVRVETEYSACGAIAGMAEWWCACWWRTDEMQKTSRGLFHFIYSQGYRARQTDISRTGWVSVQAVHSG